MKILTVFTPTYNRGYRITNLYESLLRQSNKNFNWLVIDDGSNDNTKELVTSWKLDNKINIEYIYQENQGVSVAHQTALYNINTDYNVCIDSDDFMPDDAVEIICQFISENDLSNYAGFICLDAYESGAIIGDKFPSSLVSTTFSDLTEKHKITGDKKIINKTSLCKLHLPYPSFEGEKFPTVSYLYLLINKEYSYLVHNEVVCIVEYLPDGISMNKNSHYIKYPRGFKIFRLQKMTCSPNYLVRFRHAIHFISSSIFALDFNIFKNNKYILTTLLAIPFGIFLNLYIRYNNSKSFNKSLNETN